MRVYSRKGIVYTNDNKQIITQTTWVNESHKNISAREVINNEVRTSQFHFYKVQKQGN